MIGRHPQITESHLAREAVAYLRQSTPKQRETNVGSTAVQRDLPTTLQALGWPLDRIVVIEELGVSAATSGRRRLFNALIERIKTGRVGIFAVAIESRLARNLLDLARLATVARQFDVLLAYGDQLFNLRDPNSEFVGLILALNAVRENRAKADFNKRSRRKKAEQGIATTTPPTGYLSAEGGIWEKHPDHRVRQVIELLFDKFLELGSAGKVARYLRRQAIQLPRLGRKGSVVWGDATPAKVVRFLRNEAYAGTYIYGKTAVDEAADPDSIGRRIQQPPPKWVRKEGHHEPYVAPHRWPEIQQRLTENRWNRSPVGRGEALLQGLLQCTTHKVPFRTTYSDRQRSTTAGVRRLARYYCRPGEGVGNATMHASALARVLDPLVEAELFGTLGPPTLEDIQQAIREAFREHDTLVRLRQDELRRAEHALAEAERAFDQVPEDQPWLKRRLGARVNEAARKLEEVQTFQILHPLIPPLALDDAELAELSGLLEDFPALWRSPHVTPDQRKTVVRCVIQGIDVTPHAETWLLHIQWVGGAVTTRELVTHEGARAMLRRLYDEGLSPADIAAQLNAAGVVRWRGTKAGTLYDEADIRDWILKKGLQRPFDQEAAAYIRSRYVQGAPLRHIAQELNEQGNRHYLGCWTDRRVIDVMGRLRRCDIPGIEPLPRGPSIDEALRAVYDPTLTVQEIACRLQDQGVLTRRRRPVRARVLYRALKRLRLPVPFTMDKDRVDEFLKRWAPILPVPDLVRRLNELGLRTRTGRSWSRNSVYGRLAALHLPFFRMRPITPTLRRKIHDAHMRLTRVSTSGDASRVADA